MHSAVCKYRGLKDLSSQIKKAIPRFERLTQLNLIEQMPTLYLKIRLIWFDSGLLALPLKDRVATAFAYPGSTKSNFDGIFEG